VAAPSPALAQADERARLLEAAVRAAGLLWRELDPNDVSGSWERERIGDRLLLAVSQAQLLAAMSADDYADLMLAAQEIEAEAAGKVNAQALAGVASDGRDLADLLLQPVVTTAVARAGGAAPAEAMNAGIGALTRIVGTQVADAGRAASSLAVAARPGVSGYIRMLVGTSCGRCAILAGRWYRWDAGFNRHPLCNCIGIPADEDTADDAMTEPMAYFRSLSKAEQDKAFTKSGAQAVRDGADISQVVNARRGALGLDAPGRLTVQERQAGQRTGDRFRHLQRVDAYGRSVAATTEGTTIRGLAGKRLLETSSATKRVNGRTVVKTPRLMPEAIYDLATNREDAIRLLRRFGYIL